MLEFAMVASETPTITGSSHLTILQRSFDYSTRHLLHAWDLIPRKAAQIAKKLGRKYRMAVSPPYVYTYSIPNIFLEIKRLLIIPFFSFSFYIIPKIITICHWRDTRVIKCDGRVLQSLEEYTPIGVYSIGLHRSGA